MASALDLMGPGILRGLDQFGASLAQGFAQRAKIRDARAAREAKAELARRKEARQAARQSREDLDKLIREIRPDFTVDDQPINPLSPQFAERFTQMRNQALLQQAQALGLVTNTRNEQGEITSTAPMTDPMAISERLAESGIPAAVTPSELRKRVAAGFQSPDTFREQAFANELRQRSNVLGIDEQLVNDYLSQFIDVPSAPAFGVEPTAQPSSSMSGAEAFQAAMPPAPRPTAAAVPSFLEQNAVDLGSQLTQDFTGQPPPLAEQASLGQIQEAMQQIGQLNMDDPLKVILSPEDAELAAVRFPPVVQPQPAQAFPIQDPLTGSVIRVR